MERGKVRSLSGHSGGGTIADGQGKVIKFSTSDIVGKDRIQINTGDQVWFERIGTDMSAKAINIRRC